MRIVSQNGKYDVPYENGELICESNMVLYNGFSHVPRSFAEYSSPQKAKKAMEMLHAEYVGIMPSLFISDFEISPVDLENIVCYVKGGQITTASNQGSVEYHELPRIFRFPADEEIEVE